MNIMFFDLIDSTNEYIKRNIDNLNNLDIVSSFRQTTGKGRKNRVWMSDGNNLYFSILIKKHIEYSKIFNYIMISSLALVETLKSYNVFSTIKYPNDILVQGKKIAGILIEAGGLSKVDYLVVGIGLNINQKDFLELNSKAISLSIINNQDYDTKEVLTKYIENFVYYLKSNDVELLKEYKNYSLILGKCIVLNNAEYKVIDIYTDGLVELEGKNGIEKFSFNEISLENIYREVEKWKLKKLPW